ncbi:Phosphatidic acid phosphatase type 2/haloperoxidase [Phaffia rhodozyma]|uniref:Phosphatidic acid phosphatase type 2/haloperoxidase n=1 Tax=Phaffia rhodozyma TaxID=264483 RepID=A0A0F7SQG1_PHARH|nr:Phosphatidic acid phosphatase type 2/haloperoxidase [Phaffia rhodozyma]
MAMAVSSSTLPPHQQSLIPLSSRTSAGFIRYLLQNIINALKRLNTQTSPSVTIQKLQRHRWSLRKDYPYAIQAAVWVFSLYVMEAPRFPFKLIIPVVYAIITMVPILGQFFFPATPILTWLILFYSSRYIPENWRPAVHVSLLPTLESVLYGANISDILTRFTHPVLDLLAWFPYGVVHFVIPFVVAAIAFVFGPRGSINFWGKAFGYMNMAGVIIQIVFPCAPPWYELIHGLTPANYSMAGSAGGLARIDHLFGGSGYTETFSNSPMVFGAFPSLHAGSATIEALFLTHFFPRFKVFYWIYVAVLYWATMYLTHHYLIDAVAGACLATFCFYYWLPAELREWETGGVGRFDEYSLVNNLRDAPSSPSGSHRSLDDEIRKLEEGDPSPVNLSHAHSHSHSLSQGPSQGQGGTISRPASRNTNVGGTSSGSGGATDGGPSRKGPDGEIS